MKDERSEDDGEHGAGEPLLHMMRALGAIDVLVVVTRWFGGILLGPDRFKRTIKFHPLSNLHG